MTNGEVLALILFMDAVAAVVAWAVVYGGTRKPWPCMEEHPCYECQLETL